MHDDGVMQRVHVVVRGVVQGVGYRYTARSEAQAGGLRGWVRNRRDGSVEAELEGDTAAVEAMVEWMRHGPPGAEVAEVQIAPVDAEHGAGTREAGFQVLPTE